MKQVVALYREMLRELPLGGGKFLWRYSWLLASLAVFDALALGLLSLVLGPISTGAPLVLPVFGEVDDTGLIWMVALICVVLIAKSGFAVVVTWWATRRLPKYEVAVGDRLLRAYLNAPWRERLRRNSNEIMRFTDSGVDATINAFLVPGATLLSEAVTLVVVILTVGIVQPLIALTTLVYLLVLAAMLFYGIARRARVAGEENVRNSIRTSRLVLEAVAAMKEVTLRNKEGEIAEVVVASRAKSAQARANITFLGELPRFALEAGLVGGFVVIGAVGYFLGGVEQATSGIVLFALAGFRVAPSVIRFQSVVSRMIAAAEFPRQILKELRATEHSRKQILDGDRKFPAHPRRIEFTDVTFAYERDAAPAVDGVTLQIPFGSSIAFVGASGSGKSTLVDLLLGLLEPSSGSITIDGLPLAELRRAWRARVAYVPQEVALFDATIGQNVALTWGDDYDRERAEAVLRKAQVWDFVQSREGGLDARVGERGLALSGGQRQRLGIARALYAEPLVLVLDEATSALDTATEAEVTAAIASIGSDVTKVVVAHRLATIRDSDMICFMRNGKVAGQGRFDELIAQFDDFAQQAELAGLA